MSKLVPCLSNKELRTIIYADTTLPQDEWHLEYPYDLKDEALRDLLKNVKSNRAKGGNFQIKFIAKKERFGSITILKKHWNRPGNAYSQQLLIPQKFYGRRTNTTFASQKTMTLLPKTIMSEIR